MVTSKNWKEHSPQGFYNGSLIVRSRLEANRAPPLGTLKKAVEGTVKKERYAYRKELHYTELNGVEESWFQRAGESRDPRSPTRQGADRGYCTWSVHWRASSVLFRGSREEEEDRGSVDHGGELEETHPQPGDKKEVVHVVSRRSNFTAHNPHKPPGLSGYTRKPAAPSAPWGMKGRIVSDYWYLPNAYFIR